MPMESRDAAESMLKETANLSSSAIPGQGRLQGISAARRRDEARGRMKIQFNHQ